MWMSRTRWTAAETFHLKCHVKSACMCCYSMTCLWFYNQRFGLDYRLIKQGSYSGPDPVLWVWCSIIIQWWQTHTGWGGAKRQENIFQAGMHTYILKAKVPRQQDRWKPHPHICEVGGTVGPPPNRLQGRKDMTKGKALHAWLRTSAVSISCK